MTESPHEPSPEDLATTFIARQIQNEEPEADYWNALATKVDAFLVNAYPERSLPHGYAHDDLRQDVFIRLVSSMKTLKLEGRDRFWGFVKRLADNAAIDAARHLKAQKRGGDRAPVDDNTTDGRDVLAEAFDDRLSTASGHARAAEIEEHELDCVHRLAREESRTVYLMRRRELRSYDEIAEAIGRRKAVTVRTIYARAQREVTACLAAKLDGYVSNVHTRDE